MCSGMCCRKYITVTYTNHVYRPCFVENGLWDQIRIDHGLEWILTLYVQETIAHLRTNMTRAPHLQTSSKLVCVNENESVNIRIPQ